MDSAGCFGKSEIDGNHHELVEEYQEEIMKQLKITFKSFTILDVQE